jgi:hypothetical protein
LLFEGGLAKRWLILKLLDDDYLGSTMTNQKYEGFFPRVDAKASVVLAISRSARSLPAP